jgi:hypothetical protein
MESQLVYGRRTQKMAMKRWRYSTDDIRKPVCTLTPANPELAFWFWNTWYSTRTWGFHAGCDERYEKELDICNEIQNRRTGDREFISIDESVAIILALVPPSSERYDDFTSFVIPRHISLDIPSKIGKLHLNSYFNVLISGLDQHTGETSFFPFGRGQIRLYADEANLK